jgi:hypothetical protein
MSEAGGQTFSIQAGTSEERKDEEEVWTHKGLHEDLISKDLGKIPDALQILNDELTFATTRSIRDMKAIRFIDPLIDLLTLEPEPALIFKLSANCLLNLVDINADFAQAVGIRGIESVSS